MKTLIKNVWVLTMDDDFTEYKNGAVGISNGNFNFVGQSPTEQYDEIIDGAGALLLPGFINMHTHLGMIPFRTLGDDMPDRLRRLLFPLENSAMTAEIVYHSSKYAMAEMLLSGTTTFVDMYYFEDEVAKATIEMGMRGFLGETVIDFPTCDSKEAYGGLVYADNFINKWQHHDLITPFIAPHGTNTLTPEKLQEAFALAQKYNTWFSLHVAEMDYEMKHFAETYNLTPVAFLEKIGVLNNKTIAAHCIHTTAADHAILQKHGVSVAHCVGANMKAGKGIASIQEMVKQNVQVAFGTDGPASGNTLDLLMQLALFPKAQKTKYQDRSLFPAKKVIQMATKDAATYLQLVDKIGTIEVGKEADFMLIETKSVNMYPIYDPYAAIVYSANASNVQDVWVKGKRLVANKALTTTTLSTLREQLDVNTTSFRKYLATL